MVSVIEEKREREGRRLQQQQHHHYNDYLQLESSAYSLFVLAINLLRQSRNTFRDLDIFLILLKLQQEKEPPLRSAVIC